ncbi:type II toxin-antitoxin system RelE/ParE family toxin [Sulfurimonas sp.]|uniref:type II toxin-antitoxin system RelE/ParE family toxin n=1 Tax=Sulfurimonas sp. TaxID=2022749 RepID=UPI003D14F766
MATRETAKMKIVVTKTYEDQLQAILANMLQKDPNSPKSFKMYLDTILLNIPTKDKKYKQSKYFEDENVKDIEHEGFTIVFYHDQEKNTYVILGILEI